MQTARMAVPTLLAIAAVAAIVLATPLPSDEGVSAAEAPDGTPYSSDHARIPAGATAEPIPTF